MAALSETGAAYLHSVPVHSLPADPDSRREANPRPYPSQSPKSNCTHSAESGGRHARVIATARSHCQTLFMDSPIFQRFVHTAPSLTWYELATPAQIRGAAPSSPTLGSNTTVRSMNVFDSRRNVASKLISILGPCSRRELPHAGQRASACVRQ